MMKKNFKFVLSVLSVIATAFLLSIPLSFMIDSVASAANAGQNNVNISSSYVDEAGDDYIFVVLDNEEDVPLAASPTYNNKSTALGIVVCVSLIAMLGVAYISWYSMVRKNIKNYSYLIPDSELKSLVPAKAFVHPVELHEAEYEVQYRAANKYMN